MPWINVAELSRLMQRMNTALEIRIKEAAADLAELRKSGPLVRHEAAMLATLASVISSSYDGSEDEEYQQYAARLKQEALGLRKAVEDGDFAAASKRIAAVGRSCKDCHDDYRFSDDF
jgi:cytochrome c556